ESPTADGLKSFSATSQPLSRSTARQISANVPSPTFSFNSKRSATRSAMPEERYHTPPEHPTSPGSLEQSLQRDGYAVVPALDATALATIRAAYDRLSRSVRGFDSTILSREPGDRVAVDAAIRGGLTPVAASLVGGR